jgi:hypothetical protein
VYDLLKGALLLTSALVLGLVQVSRVYHYIRGEAIIKLYVIFNILEIFDKLCCSLGQDVMEGLYATTRDQLNAVPAGDSAAARRQLRAVAKLSGHFAIAVAYVVFHSAVLFVQIVCLNVAINSRNNALLTLLVSNNFVELKGSVFKRFEAENLFQVSCSDTVERFQLSLFLVLIAAQELSSWSAASSLLPAMVRVRGRCASQLRHDPPACRQCSTSPRRDMHRALTVPVPARCRPLCRSAFLCARRWWTT